MNNVSFGSTFRIPVRQDGIKKTQVTQLKSLIGSYSGIIVGKGNEEAALVSMANSRDNSFLWKLRKIGYYMRGTFKGENIKKENLEAYVKEQMSIRK